MITRKPIKINRKPIRLLTLRGEKKTGGLFVFEPHPDDKKPRYKVKSSPNNNTLFCPYCAEWLVFTKDAKYSSDEWYCPNCNISGNDYWIKTVNHLWGNFSEMPKKSKGGKKK